MSRLLFAAARGARIGWQTLSGKWNPANITLSLTCLQSEYGQDAQRIHPADEHLQYGLVSTALREIALTDDCNAVDLPYIEVALLREEGHYPTTKEQFGVFLLILAECLADEGL